MHAKWHVVRVKYALGACRQWGPNFCYTSKKPCTRQPSTDRFTLHGLWPNLDNPCREDFPEHCQDDAFDPSNIPAGTRAKMTEDWPSYMNCERADVVACLRLLCNHAIMKGQL